jgi:hypothetical protein
MWRLCDLHMHTVPNEQLEEPWDAKVFVQSRLAIGLNVVAITDHDQCDRLAEAIEAAIDTDLVVIAGVELSTDRGHLIVLAPDPDGAESIRSFMSRLGAGPGQQLPIQDILDAAKSARIDGPAWTERLVFIGAHVDQPGSLLSGSQQLNLAGQLQLAAQVHALEVVNDQTRSEWTQSGVKHGPKMTLTRASDAHSTTDVRLLATWLYLPEITASSFQHAFALRESSVDLSSSAPSGPAYVIESVNFIGGHHDGLRFDFCERTNAVIGPPNSGKSLIVDALKFAFGIESGLEDVERVSASRRAKCLPPGSVVEVVVRGPEGSFPVSRAVGARPPTAPFTPIVFSQTELTRRAAEASPSIGLLDLHVPGAQGLKQAIDEAASRVADQFAQLLRDARAAAQLRSSVGNTVDGLAATTEALRQLAGAEETAKMASAATGAADWRRRVQEEIERWRDEVRLTSPTIPPAPVIDDDVTPGLANFASKAAVDAAVTGALTAAENAVRDAAANILDALAGQEEAFADRQIEIEAQLAAAGFERGSEVEIKLAQLRERLNTLQTENYDLAELDARTDQGLVTLRAAHAVVADARGGLTNARRAACSSINSSMRAFFVRVEQDTVASRLDSLIEELKTGTHMRAPTRHDLRDNLDRFAVLEAAIRRAQGLRSGEETSDQERVVQAALKRDRSSDLAKLSCLWPGDALVLAMLGETGTPTPFSELTEGLRALAIKEISFATSDLPVITDQPEDAVPTRAVFENLVPTLREQRKRRQFIVVSHDANIVVASDVEQITVLHANEDQTPHSGNLFDPRIRASALEHLEGGRLAFQLRADRYAAMGDS